MDENTFALRLHALMRLLVSEGHMTPAAVRQIEKLIPTSRRRGGGATDAD